MNHLRQNAALPFILVTLLLGTLGIGVIVPVLPRLIGSFLQGDLSRASAYHGGFVAVYAAMQFVFAPILGGLSDRFGRRPVVLTSLAGAAIDLGGMLPAVRLFAKLPPRPEGGAATVPPAGVPH